MGEPLEMLPPELVNAAVRGDLVLLVGSGVSSNSTTGDASSSLHPPGWPELLKRLAQSIGIKSEGDPRKTYFESLLDARSFVLAGEYISYHARQSGRGRDLQSELKKCVDGETSAPFQPNSWHDAIFNLTPRVIITTNYDRIIERATGDSFQVHTHTSKDAASDIRRGDPTLIKIHGCVNGLNDIVLSQADYTRLHLQGGSSLETIKALFLTRVVLFVGYSLVDPDIRLLLENTVGGRNVAPSHYMIASSVEGFQKDIFSDCFGVNVLEYSVSKENPWDHSAGLQYLENLNREVAFHQQEGDL